jgi:hypothetical protein
MTRAFLLLERGDVTGSLRMHPLAVPVLGSGVLLILATIWVTLVSGTPFLVHRSRFGRIAIAVSLLVYSLAAVLWVLRWLGYFGGPVAVDY